MRPARRSRVAGFSAGRTAAALGWVLSAGCAWAGSISATVKDKSGAPLPNAVIYVVPLGAASPPAAGSPEPATVNQQDFQFSPLVTVVRVGTPVFCSIKSGPEKPGRCSATLKKLVFTY